MLFENHVVIVTGGSQGMGESHVRAFAREGASVVIADLLDDEGRALAADIGEHADFVHIDVTSEEDWAALVQSAEERFGPVTVLVNNAGVTGSNKLLLDDDLAAWRRVIDVNLVGTYLGIREVVPSMQRAGGGSIVNIASTAGLRGGFPGASAYASSKWAVRGLTKTAAVELGSYGIRVNAVCPGPVVTPLYLRAKATRGVPSVSSQPSRGRAPWDELSDMVLFLASNRSSFSTGGDFVADGGQTAGLPPGGRG